MIAAIVILGRCAPALHKLRAGAPALSVEALVAAAKDGVRRTEHESAANVRESAAVEAVDAAQRCVQVDPRSAACAYWLGAALGVQARERPTTAHAALPILLESFERAAAIDPLVEEAGPDRALALVYLRAPGWPAGPGDPDRGLEHARRAVELRPDYPPNLLALAEALDATDDRPAAREACLRAVDRARAAAGAGDREAADWLNDAQAFLERLTKP